MNGLPPPTGARHAPLAPCCPPSNEPGCSRSRPITSEMARHYVLGADDLALVRARRRVDQPARLRRPAMRCSAILAAAWDPAEQPPEQMIAFVAQSDRRVDPALFADYAQRDQTRREHVRRTAKVPGSAELRARRLARLPSGRRGRGVGHGSRRAHRPGDARSSASEQRSCCPRRRCWSESGWPPVRGRERKPSRRSRPGCPTRSGIRSRGCLTVDPELRRSRFAWLRDYSESPAPSNIVALLDRLEYARGLGIDPARAGRIHAARLARLIDEGRDHDRPAHRRTRTRAANGDPRGPGRQPRNPADRRDARHVREIHGHPVQPGTEPRRAAFPGNAARCRQGTGPVPPHHRRAPAREGSRRGRRRRGRTRDRHGAARRRAARHRGRRRCGGPGHSRHGGRAIFGAAPVQPALPRRVRLPVEHAERSGARRRRSSPGDGSRRHPRAAQTAAVVVPAAAVAQADLRERRGGPAALRNGGARHAAREAERQQHLGRRQPGLSGVRGLPAARRGRAGHGNRRRDRSRSLHRRPARRRCASA